MKMQLRAHFGRVLYHVWHQPVGILQRCLKEGGPLEQRRSAQGRMAMEAAAAQLSAESPAQGAPVMLHVVTGQRFWYQTAFCLWSFARQAGRPIAPVIYDDGTLNSRVREPLSRAFPRAQFIEQGDTVARLDARLPASRFPSLRERWLNYPHIRKIIDPHVGRTGWKLVIDSDLLFFRRPDFLLAWLDCPACPLHAVDCESSYGYPRPLLDKLAGRSVRDLVNVGLTGLNGAEIDWDLLELWCRELGARAGYSYYLEQALVAMLVAGRSCSVAPATDYVTLPRPPEALECRAVMHHYVAESKRWYFQHNWRRALQAAP